MKGLLTVYLAKSPDVFKVTKQQSDKTVNYTEQMPSTAEAEYFMQGDTAV